MEEKEIKVREEDYGKGMGVKLDGGIIEDAFGSFNEVGRILKFIVNICEGGAQTDNPDPFCDMVETFARYNIGSYDDAMKRLAEVFDGLEYEPIT